MPYAIGALLVPLLLRLAAWAAAPLVARFDARPLGSGRGRIGWETQRIAEGDATRARPTVTVTVAPGEVARIAPSVLVASPVGGATTARLGGRGSRAGVAIGADLFDAVEVAARDRPLALTLGAAAGTRHEIGLIALDEGAELLVDPRALRGWIASATAPVRIERRWLDLRAALAAGRPRGWFARGPGTLVLATPPGLALLPISGRQRLAGRHLVGWSAALAVGLDRGPSLFAWLRGQRALFDRTFGSAGTPGAVLVAGGVVDGVRRGRTADAVADAALKGATG